MQEVLNCIEDWNHRLKSNPDFCDIALLKIYIKFEKYIIKSFIWYSIGGVSQSGYIPERRLNFIAEEQITAFILSAQNKSKGYIEINLIENLSRHIFIEQKDPFGLLFNDSIFKPTFLKLTAIRNYVAHESSSSREKYIKQLLNDKYSDFIEPFEYLKRHKQSGCSNYTFFIEQIKSACEIIDNPSMYFSNP